MTKQNNHTVEPSYVMDIVNLYVNGIEQKEITERTGQTYSVVRYWLKKKGLYDPKRRQTGKCHAMQGINQANTTRKQEAENRLTLFLLDKGFKYIDGYDGRDSHFKVQCLTCGGTFTRGLNSHAWKQNHLRCPICDERERAAKQSEQATRQQQRVQQQEEYRQKRLERELEKQKFRDEVHICKECGCLYTNRSYAQSIGVDPKYVQRIDCCSRECLNKYERKSQRKYNATHGKHKLRAIKYGVEFDKTVNLNDMLIRYGTKCAICGCECNLKDYKVVNGVRICGDDYPSIDHIIPMSKGGGHVWNNVQVAHRSCNTKKGASVAV